MDNDRLRNLYEKVLGVLDVNDPDIDDFVKLYEKVITDKIEKESVEIISDDDDENFSDEDEFRSLLEKIRATNDEREEDVTTNDESEEDVTTNDEREEDIATTNDEREEGVTSNDEREEDATTSEKPHIPKYNGEDFITVMLKACFDPSSESLVKVFLSYIIMLGMPDKLNIIVWIMSNKKFLRNIIGLFSIILAVVLGMIAIVPVFITILSVLAYQYSRGEEKKKTFATPYRTAWPSYHGGEKKKTFKTPYRTPRPRYAE